MSSKNEGIFKMEYKTLEIKKEDKESYRWNDKHTFTEIANSAQYVNETAKNFSRKNKKPVFILCNARNGTLLHYGIEKWSDQLSKEERDEFVKDLKNNPTWLESKVLALFETAQKWIDDKKLEWFTYSTQHVKVSSYSRKNPEQPAEKLPNHFPKMLKKGINFVVADISERKFPGSFGKGCGFETDTPGFKEIFEKENYNVEMISRLSNLSLKDRLFQRFKKPTPTPAALLINPLRGEDYYYSDINNHPEVIGWLGKKFAHHNESKMLELISKKRINPKAKIRMSTITLTSYPVFVKTNHGKMDLSNYIRIKIQERLNNDETKQ